MKDFIVRSLTIYLLLLIFFGKPFAKLIVGNQYFFIYFLLIIYLLFFLQKLKNKNLIDTFIVSYLLLVLILIINILLYGTENLKIGFMLIVPLVGKISYDYQDDIYEYFKKNKIFVVKYQLPIFLIILIQILVGRSGSYSLIHYEVFFIDGNIFNFKSQRIAVLLIVLVLVISDELKLGSQFVIALSIGLLLPLARSVFIIYLLIFIVFLLIKKARVKNLKIFILTIIFLFSGVIDYIGYYSNIYLINSVGQNHYTLFCQFVYDSNGIDIDKKLDMENSFYELNLPQETYPRFFSTSTVLSFLNIEVNESQIMTRGKKGLCEKFLDLSKTESDIQQNQLEANVNFRVLIWNYAYEQSKENIILGSGLNENILNGYDYAFTNTHKTKLWHLHNSFLTIYAYFGLIGLLLILFLMIVLIHNIKFINFKILLMLFPLALLSLLEAVLEIPDLGILFWFLLGLLSSKKKHV